MCFPRPGCGIVDGGNKQWCAFIIKTLLIQQKCIVYRHCLQSWSGQGKKTKKNFENRQSFNGFLGYFDTRRRELNKEEFTFCLRLWWAVFRFTTKSLSHIFFRLGLSNHCFVYKSLPRSTQQHFSTSFDACTIEWPRLLYFYIETVNSDNDKLSVVFAQKLSPNDDCNKVIRTRHLASAINHQLSENINEKSCVGAGAISISKISLKREISSNAKRNNEQHVQSKYFVHAHQ